jgi:hypothetical protein
MTGLMTGRGRWLEPPKQVSAIMPSLMRVVENALSWAWRELLSDVAKGAFSICGAKEDEITTYLYGILCRMYARDPNTVPGLASFETPVREGNVANHDGAHPDRQPDLTFRPLRGHIPTVDASLAGIFVECKPVDADHSVTGAYCGKGLIRFVQGDYAWAVDRALMVGYVRNRCKLPEGLRPCFGNGPQRVDYRPLGEIEEVAETSEGDRVFQTIHSRTFLLGTGPAGPIILDHLWLYSASPCEPSRCQGMLD